MKATWVGCLALGRLGIPVRLYSATKQTRRRFIQLHEKDGSRVERVPFCRDEQHEISSDEIVRAVEHGSGQLVTLTDQEIKQSASVPNKVIEVKQFALPHAIPLIYYEKPYYITPGEGGERAYAVVREALVRANAVAAVTFILQTNEHVGIIGVYEDILVLYQLRFASEIVPRGELKTPPMPKASPTELDTLESVIERYSGALHLRDYHDEQSERLEELIERKAKGLPKPRKRLTAQSATPAAEIVSALQDTLNGQVSLLELEDKQSKERAHKAM